MERITVYGNLFYASLDRLRRQLQGNPTVHTVLDLSAVAYCDAAARNMISSVQKTRSRCGGSLEIKPPIE